MADDTPFAVTEEDLAYARGQHGAKNSLVFGDRPWEEHLLSQASGDRPTLGQVILDRLQEYMRTYGAEDERTPRLVRAMLNWVYATLYHSCHAMLPLLDEGDLKAMESSYGGGEPSQKVLDEMSEDLRMGMERYNKKWSRIFRGIDEKKKLPDPCRYFVLACARLVLIRVDDARLREEERKGGKGRKGRKKKKAKQGSSAEKWGALLAREVRPVLDTKVTFSDIGGCHGPKGEMIELSWLLSQPDGVMRFGTVPPRGVLLIGPPGTGKTLSILATAKHSSRPLFRIKMSDLFSMWYGQSLAYLERLFAEARKMGKCIIFLDEADGFVPTRNQQHIHEESRRFVTQFNLEMEAVKPEEKVCVILGTNFEGELDEAATRDQRIDQIVRFTLPNLAERREILAIHRGKAESLAGRRLFTDGIGMDDIAALADGLSGAGLANIIERALRHKALQSVRDGTSDSELMVSHTDLVSSTHERLRERAAKIRRIGFKTDPAPTRAPRAEDAPFILGPDDFLPGDPV